MDDNDKWLDKIHKNIGPITHVFGRPVEQEDPNRPSGDKIIEMIDNAQRPSADEILRRLDENSL